jgi:hypothetical protein
MAYEIGFVTNTGSEGLAHWQMLLKIKAFAEANGWTTLRYLTPSDGTPRELIMVGPGLSGDDQIYVGFRTYHDVSADYYNLSSAGFTGYVPTNAFIAQPGYVECGIPSHNQRIDYWLIVNPQRIAFGLKVGTPVYESGYAGLFLPYATPGQYPYPIVVGGMLSGIPATRYSETTHSMPYKGARAGMRMRFVDGNWLQPACYPWNNTEVAGTTNSVRDTGGVYMLIPVMLWDGSNIYGELDGIYQISGFNNVVENTITLDGKTYVVIQDVSRTGFVDYYALELS